MLETVGCFISWYGAMFLTRTPIQMIPQIVLHRCVGTHVAPLVRIIVGSFPGSSTVFVVFLLKKKATNFCFSQKFQARKQ